jgi:hypothetical protein
MEYRMDMAHVEGKFKLVVKIADVFQNLEGSKLFVA